MTIQISEGSEANLFMNVGPMVDLVTNSRLANLFCLKFMKMQLSC